MELRRRKKAIAAACNYSYTELALNYYMCYEIFQEKEEGGFGLAQPFYDRYHKILKRFLNGENVEEELSDLREDAIAEMNGVVAYVDRMQAYETILKRLKYRFVPPQENLKDNQTLTEEIMAYILCDKESVGVNQRIQEVMRELPVRLTKNKFFAMTEEGLSIYKGGSVYSFRMILDLLRSEGLLRSLPVKEGYEYLASAVKEFCETDYRQMEQAAYEHLSEKMEEITPELLENTEALHSLMDLINSLTVICLTKKDSVQEVSEKQHIEAILQGVLALFEKEEKEEIPETLTEHLSFLEGKQEGYFDIWLRNDVPEQEEGKSETDCEDSFRFRKVELLMSGSAYMELVKDAKEEEDEVEEAFFKESLEALFTELQTFWKDCPKVLVRASMAKILSSLPVFFQSIEAVRSYIESSLDSCSDEAELLGCMEELRERMKGF